MDQTALAGRALDVTNVVSATAVDAKGEGGEAGILLLAGMGKSSALCQCTAWTTSRHQRASEEAEKNKKILRSVMYVGFSSISSQ